jgi:hypothetical protein
MEAGTMQRTLWAEQLAEVIRPTAAKAATTQIAQLLRYLTDMPDEAFVEASVQYVANRKAGHALTLMWLRTVLVEYLHEADPPEPRPQQESPNAKLRREWQSRQEWLAENWDDPPGILRKVHAHRDDRPMLRLLARIVGMWAPQHLGLLPPDVLEEVARDPEMQLPVFVALRDRLGDAPAPVYTATHTQGEKRRPVPSYLDPAYLDRINPLPNGRKRTDATHTLSQQQVPDGGRATATAALAEAQARATAAYPWHDDC